MSDIFTVISVEMLVKGRVINDDSRKKRQGQLAKLPTERFHQKIMSHISPRVTS